MKRSHGKPRGVFAEPSDLSAKASLATAEVKNALYPCGKPYGFLTKKDE